MSLTSMIRSTLGMGAVEVPTRSHAESVFTRKAGIAGGAFVSAYVNGRFSSPGKDHLEVKLPDFLGGKQVPADLTFAVVASTLALFDMTPFGLDELIDHTADGVLAQYITRIGTRMGSEHKIKALAASTSDGTKQAASGLFDLRPREARKYAMAG